MTPLKRQLNWMDVIKKKSRYTHNKSITAAYHEILQTNHNYKDYVCPS